MKKLDLGQEIVINQRLTIWKNMVKRV